MLGILLRTSAIYFIIILVLRFLGKREVGELSIFDLVILLIIADIASIGVDNKEFFFPSIICLALLASLQKLFSLLLLKVSYLRNLFDGSPRIIIENGEINYKNMKRELYTIDDLIFQMHQDHIMNIKEIRLAILETNGTLSLFRKSHFDEIVLPIITSGRIDKENCKYSNITKSEIEKLLIKNNLNAKNIIYAYVEEGFLYYFYNNKEKEENLKENSIRLL